MIRVVENSGQRRAAWISLLVASCAGVVMVGAWYAFTRTPPVRAAQRGLADMALDYRCEQGHAFTRPGTTGEVLCAQCQRPAYALVEYFCAKDHSLRLEVRFASELRDGWPVVSAVRLTGGEWQSAGDTVPCPQCGAALAAAPFGWK